MGGHHFNKPSKDFLGYLEEIGDTRRDLCDIDGYLSIDQPKGLLMKAREEDAKILMKALQVAFPRITRWVNVPFEIVASPSAGEKFKIFLSQNELETHTL